MPLGLSTSTKHEPGGLLGPNCDADYGANYLRGSACECEQIEDELVRSQCRVDVQIDASAAECLQ